MFDHIINIPPMSDNSMAEMAQEITSDVTMQANIVHIAEGNIGAMNVMRNMFQTNESKAAFSLGLCAAWGITGSMLWLLYKDVNNQDVSVMMDMVIKDEARNKLEALPYGGYKRR